MDTSCRATRIYTRNLPTTSTATSRAPFRRWRAGNRRPAPFNRRCDTRSDRDRHTTRGRGRGRAISAFPRRSLLSSASFPVPRDLVLRILRLLQGRRLPLSDRACEYGLLFISDIDKMMGNLKARKVEEAEFHLLIRLSCSPFYGLHIIRTIFDRHIRVVLDRKCLIPAGLRTAHILLAAAQGEVCCLPPQPRSRPPPATKCAPRRNCSCIRASPTA